MDACEEPCTSLAGRNLFVELLGKSESEVDAKLAQAWSQLFAGTDGVDTGQRVYYEAGIDEAYILDVNNNDVRSEGMSYGMMIAVQMDKRAEFDRLWRWSSRHMRHPLGNARAGYFAWQCGADGQVRDPNPASDGEEYFATSLLFAAARWGQSAYRDDAQTILDTMLHKEDGGVVDSVTNMFNRSHAVVFVPYASAALYTDPSYHLPAFYEVWARLAARDNEFWTLAAEQSRVFFRSAAHASTGLMPDYANFDGTPTGGEHQDFRFDAWRAASNVAVDYAWFHVDAWQKTQSERLLAFFTRQGLDTYGNKFAIDGTPIEPRDHSPGLVAMNAVAGLASSPESARPFVQALWELPVPVGRYRYYDGMLYVLGLLHVSGHFRAYGL